MDTVAVIGLLIIVYTYVGYPLLVVLLARLRPFRARAGDERWEPSVSVCIAAHGGREQLARKLRNLFDLDYPAEKLEILVYSDGATDGCNELVQAFAAHDPRVRLIVGGERRGKPTALNVLQREASGEVLFMTDVRPTIAPSALRVLVAALADPAVGAATGSLVLDGSAGSGVYWRYEKAIRVAEGQRGRLVGVTGAIYVIRRADMCALPVDIVLDDMWVPLRVAMKRKASIVFCPEAEAYDEAFDDEREFARKARTLAGNFQLLFRMPSLLLPVRNPLWFELVSHKLLRLACPLWLAVLFVASCSLAIGPTSRSETILWFSVTLAQIVFYTFAAFGKVAGPPGKIARTFVVLNAAAVAGFLRFARRTQRITW